MAHKKMVQTLQFEEKRNLSFVEIFSLVKNLQEEYVPIIFEKENPQNKMEIEEVHKYMY